ncbi:MAG TPA: Nramp family divalent metal transporter [Planctomycetota bacterium]|nr:Nramp family divalent metal transporter [Planctomycetota bacterium]
MAEAAPAGAPSLFRKLAASLGPGLITAAVVLGPGSITMVSKAGAAHGYRLLWVILWAGLIMAAYTVMSARIGTVTDKSILSTVAEHYGRWLAVIMGLCSFAVCTAFQAGDNSGVGASMQTIAQGLWPEADGTMLTNVFSAGFTAVSLVLILTAPNLYKAIERLMTVLVGVMIVCFFANLFPAGPSLSGIAGGLVPSYRGAEDLKLIIPITATTFSVIACLYQGYMVQNKGWKLADYRKGVWDSVVGIAVLTGLSAVIMITAAAVLNPRKVEVVSAAAMAGQLEPLLGRTAQYLFCIGLWGASFSSLVANAIIGGGLLADSLGLGRRFEDRGVKACTVLVMIVGAVVAQFFGARPVALIAFAQGLTIVFVPVCALVILMLANNRKVMGEHTNGWIQNLLGAAGLATVTGLGAYQAWQFFASLAKPVGS